MQIAFCMMLNNLDKHAFRKPRIYSVKRSSYAIRKFYGKPETKVYVGRVLVEAVVPIIPLINADN